MIVGEESSKDTLDFVVEIMGGCDGLSLGVLDVKNLLRGCCEEGACKFVV